MKLVKKAVIVLCISILCLMCTQIMSLAQTAKVTTETLRLRKKPTTDSSILELISEGESVEILESELGDDGNWYKVKYKSTGGNITGYVYGEFIKVNNKNTETSQNNNNTNKSENINKVENTTNTVVENTVGNNIIENTTTENNVIVENPTSNNEIENNNTVTKPEENQEQTINNIEKVEINTNKTIEEDTSICIIPLINASKIHTVKKGENLHIIQVLNGWAYVSLDDNSTGWIRCNKLINIEQ